MAEICIKIILLGQMATGLAVAWIYVGRRLLCHQTVLPCEPRPAAPWNGFHVIALIFLYIGLQVWLPAICDRWGPPATKSEATAAADSQDISSEHVISQLIQERHGIGAILLCLATAGLSAPLAEEFLFRLVLQGCLEKYDRQRRPWLPGTMPIVLVAILFAGIHFRMAGPAPAPSQIITILIGTLLANVFLLLIGITWLKLETGVTAADLGFVPAQLKADVRTGLLAYLAITPILFPLQEGLSRLLPETIAPDPITLLPFALLVGWLYYRTHRLVPSIVVHMALNITTLVVAVLEAAK